MKKEARDQIQKYVHPFRITKGQGFQVKDFDPADTCGLKLDKGEAAELLAKGTAWLAEEQEILYAQDRWSLLLVFQAMDAAGKDGTIKHVMSGINPQGCQVFSFNPSTLLIEESSISLGLIQSLREQSINVTTYKPDTDKRARLIAHWNEVLRTQ